MQSVFAKTVYTGEDVLRDSYVLFDGPTIAGISGSETGTVVHRCDVLTPAFIDPHTHIGMVRSGEPPYEEESNERLDTLLAHADALDSVQMDDRSFTDSIESGVLYSCVLPGSGNIIGGRSAVIRNYGKTTSDALFARSGIKAAFGYNPMSTREWKGSRPFTRMGALALLRQKLHDVKQKMQKRERETEETKEPVTFTAEEEVLSAVLSRQEVLRVHVHKADDIASLLRTADSFGLKITVEHACDVKDAQVFAELKRRGIPVIYGPVDAFAYKVELKHESWKNIRGLIESGVQFGLMSDHPVCLQKMLPLQLRWFVRSGLKKEQALAIITKQNAEILGIGEVLGTLERGKWASFTCWNGDPFDLTRHPVAVYGEGRLLYTE